MGSFPAQAARVRDRSQPAVVRLWALRECVLRFPPYGFRATWHHLILSAGIPQDLSQDPDSLVRAVDELEAARELVLPHLAAYAAHRRAEKAAGRRVPARPLPWNWGYQSLAFCPNPEIHPSQYLPVVVQRLVTAASTGVVIPDDQCPVCGGPRKPGRACPRCGVRPEGPLPRPAEHIPDLAQRWQQIWQRSFNR